MSESTKGQCLCGNVQYEFTEHLGIFQYCHCSRCRKMSGSAFLPNIIVRPQHFRWLSGEEHIKRYEVPEAKYYASQFCDTCGSTLPWPVKGGKSVVIPAGTLDEKPPLSPSQNIFCGSKADWYVEPSDLPKNETFAPKN